MPTKRNRKTKPAPKLPEIPYLRQQTQHFVQPYRSTRRGGLTPADALPMRSADVAEERAKSLFETGSYAGVDAFSVTVDPDADEYVEPVFLARLGKVPKAEYED